MREAPPTSDALDGSDAPDARSAFDRLMASSNSSMVGVLVRSDEGLGGCLVGFHCQCSIEPRRYAVWLSKANHTFRVAATASHLAVHWLRPDQMATAVVLGTVSSDDVPTKLERLDLTTDPRTQVPVLADHGGYVVGRIVDAHDDGDHVCYVLEVDAAADAGNADRLRFGDVAHLPAGHDAEDPTQPVERDLDR